MYSVRTDFWPDFCEASISLTAPPGCPSGWSYESTAGCGDSVYFLTQNLRRAAFSSFKKFVLRGRIHKGKRLCPLLHSTGTLLSAMQQPGWEGSLGENGYIIGMAEPLF